VTTSGHERPGTPHHETDPDVLVKAEEIEDLEAPAETQQNLAGGLLIRGGPLSMDPTARACIGPAGAI
jgi:hypothetical protein